MEQFLQLLWNEKFWLPTNQTWSIFDNKPNSNIYLPQRNDMVITIPLGLLLLGLRFVFEKYLMTPIGYWCGVKKKKITSCKSNPILEDYFARNTVTKDLKPEVIAKQVDVPQREIEIWLRNRKQKNAPSDIKKFNECGLHFVFYLGIFIYGLVTLWDKPWFWETKYCWKGWPNLDVGFDVYMYYVMELSFYWCLLFSVMTDNKRKDFVQMIIHHVATILLIFFSWAVNMSRIGCLVIIAHDVADFPMAAAKMMKYSGHKKLCEIFFGIFILVWIMSRLVYYPFVVVYSASVELYDYMEPFPSYYFFNGLLILLQILHIIWTYMIARIAVRKLWHDKLGDVRSDSEGDSD